MIAENKMMPSWTIQDLLADFKMTGDLAPSSKQIHVLVELPDQQQPGSTKKHLRCTGMTAEDSCCAFLYELARNLAKLYDFNCRYGDDVPIMDGVFNAVVNDDWKFRLTRGEKLTAVELPDYFAEDQWYVLKNLNQDTYRRIYDGKVATTSEGKPHIILPHDMFTRDVVDVCKGIATKARVVGEPTEFEVKDEDEILG
ncbi:hypothetical protein PR003_g34544 [Phytophthora rubi]|uniref:Uncharacterized protein n=1 Tax=Phytophthora rubi TaxID=129364 RepID=A0A6A3G5K8_9STRA|nr:hypothetical protein PR002_g32768 [Phytophthora rubi]KAE9260020.1 hypothetical protein PR003_g34544 [Phytophthora rubi]